jgi:hypothetical protein
MRFEIVGGEATRPGPGGKGTSAVLPLGPPEMFELFTFGTKGRDSPLPLPPFDNLTLVDLREFLGRWHVATVLVDPAVGYGTTQVIQYLTAAFGRSPVQSGGMDVWYHADR